MDPDEFIKSVSSRGVLTTEESLNLILSMKGSTPKTPLSFPSSERKGRWKEEFFTGLSVDLQQQQQGHGIVTSTSSRFHIPFEINFGKKKLVKIKSIFLINNSVTNNPFIRVTISTCEATISKLKNRMHLGYQLHEALFNPAVEIQSNKCTITINLPANRRPTQLRGIPFVHETRGNSDDVTISMQNIPWSFVVGFKYKDK